MKGRRTHMAREVEVHKEWRIDKRKKEKTNYETAQICTGEIFNGNIYWLFQEGYLTKRWKNVTCKSCLRCRK